MAFGEKYYFTFHDINDTKYKVSIGKDGYASSTTEVRAPANPVQLNRPTVNIEDIIANSSLDVSFFSETNLQFSEFFDAAPGTYNVKLISDPDSSAITIWEGINESQPYTEPWDAPPYPVRMTFIDGLQLLKRKRFDNAGTLWTSKMHILEVIRRCLNDLPFTLNIVEAVNVYEDGMTVPSHSPFTQAYVDTRLYREEDDSGEISVERAWHVWDVLEAILRPFGPIQLYQEDHKWHILRIEGYNNILAFNYREFAPSVGSESSTTISSTGTFTTSQRIGPTYGVQWSGIAQMEIMPPIERIRNTYKTTGLKREKGDLGLNGDFMKWQSGNIPLYWSKTGITSVGKGTKIYKNTRNYRAWEFDGADGYSAIDNTKYAELSVKNVLTDTTDKMQVSFDFEIDQDKQVADMTKFENTWCVSSGKVTIYLMVKIGSYYLVGESSSATWGTTSGYLTFSYRSGDVADGGIFTNRGGAALAVKVVLLCPVFPQTAENDLTIRMYFPVTNLDAFETIINDTDLMDLTLTTYRWGNFSLKYMPSGDVPTYEQVFRYDLNDEGRVLDIVNYHGDGPDNASLGSFRDSSNAILDLWFRTTETETLSVNEILLKSIATLRGDYSRMMSGLLITPNARITYIKNYHHFYIITGADTAYYFLNGDVWDVQDNSHNAILWQVAVGGSGTLNHYDTQNPGPDVTDNGGIKKKNINVIKAGGAVPGPVILPVKPTKIKEISEVVLSAYPK